MQSRLSLKREAFGMRNYFHSAKSEEYAIALQGEDDLGLAEAYAQYIDSPNSMYFTEIFWEANRRGLALTDLEQILLNNQ